MPNETKEPKLHPGEIKPIQPPVQKQGPPPFEPRKLKLVTDSARGMYLADAETGEDLRLPFRSMPRAEAIGTGMANVHCTFVVEKIEREKL